MRPGLIWDFPLRAFHVCLLIATSAAFVTQWLGEDWFAWHRIAGYTVWVLILFRFFWGWVGPRYARFASFVHSPTQAWVALTRLSKRRHQTSLGHNPLGGWMIVVMLVMLGLQALLGLFSQDEISEVGPLVGYVSTHLSHLLSHYHRLLSNVILAAIGLHLAAVVYYQWVLKDDLIRPMLTGLKAQVPPGEAIPSQRLWWALATLGIVAGAVGLILTALPG